MKREQNYRKGTKVWIQIPVEGGREKVRPAEVISILNNSRIFEDYMRTKEIVAYHKHLLITYFF